MLTVQVKAAGTNLPAVLTDAMTQIIRPIATPSTNSDLSLTGMVRAEAESTAELLPRLTDSLAGLLNDFEAVPIDVSIHGLRWLDGGVRVWGTVTLSRVAPARDLDIEWIVGPTLEETGGNWRIDGRARILGIAERI